MARKITIISIIVLLLIFLSPFGFGRTRHWVSGKITVYANGSYAVIINGHTSGWGIGVGTGRR
jgi:hypothetical protein